MNSGSEPIRSECVMRKETNSPCLQMEYNPDGVERFEISKNEVLSLLNTLEKLVKIQSTKC